MSSTNPAPPSNDFLVRISKGEIPGASTPNHATALPNSGGNGGGMLTVGSVDTVLQHGGLDGATTLGSMNAIVEIPNGAFNGDLFAHFESIAGKIQIPPQELKQLLSIPASNL